MKLLQVFPPLHALHVTKRNHIFVTQLMADHFFILHAQTKRRRPEHADPNEHKHRCHDGKRRKYSKYFPQRMCQIYGCANANTLLYVEPFVLGIIIEHAADPIIIVIYDDRNLFLIPLIYLSLPHDKKRHSCHEQDQIYRQGSKKDHFRCTD